MNNSTRRIVGLLGFAVIFSVIGQEINKTKTPAATNAAVNSGAVLTGPAKTILGGTIAAALLSLVAETGPAAEDWAVGLAGVATATAMLVNGGPVWQALNTVLASKPTTPVGGATAPTPSTPTVGVAKP